MHQKSPPPNQTPPEVKIAITNSAEPETRLALVSTGDRPVGRYRANTEYWRHSTLILDSFGDELTLTSANFLVPEIERNLDDFLSGTAAGGFEHDRCDLAWTWGQRQTPRGRTGHLYSMDRPGSERGLETIGVLFEVDDEYLLKAVVFYRGTSDTSPPSGQLWDRRGDFSKTLVKQDSLDPRSLSAPPSPFWYRTFMGAR